MYLELHGTLCMEVHASSISFLSEFPSPPPPSVLPHSSSAQEGEAGEPPYRRLLMRCVATVLRQHHAVMPTECEVRGSSIRGIVSLACCQYCMYAISVPACEQPLVSGLLQMAQAACLVSLRDSHITAFSLSHPLPPDVLSSSSFG